MATLTVGQFANVLKVPVERLIGQLKDAGIPVKGAADMLSEDDKLTLLAHLKTSRSTEETGTRGPEQQATSTKLRPDPPAATELERNAFAILGATMRDNRQRLMELAEEATLAGREQTANAARAQLINPRTRLAAEIGWFPGTAPAKVTTLVGGLRKNPGMVRASRGLNALTVANLMASGLELVDPAMPADEWAGWLVDLAEAEDQIDAEQVLRDINEERAVSAFPAIRDVALVEAELAERRRHYKDVTLAVLDQLNSRVLLEALTAAVEAATSGGELHAPLLIEELASAYELRAAQAIDKGATQIQGFVEAVRKSAPAGDAPVANEVSRLEHAVRQWDKLAQPVQLMTKSRGQEHEASKRLAYEVRSLAVELVNDYGFIEQGGRLTTLLSEVFAELPQVADRLESDAEALDNLRKQREEGERQSAEWAREITYSTKIGLVFKYTLAISPQGVVWDNQSYPLDAVTRVRWGGVSNSNGTTYTIAFGDERSQAVCETSRQEVFDAFVPRLFRSVGFSLLIKMLKTFANGGKVRLGEAVVDDNGVAVPRHGFFGVGDPVYLRWHELKAWSADGRFVIASKTDKKVYAQMEYLHTDNLHLLEYAIRTFLKSKHSRLSQVFDG